MPYNNAALINGVAPLKVRRAAFFTVDVLSGDFDSISLAGLKVEETFLNRGSFFTVLFQFFFHSRKFRVMTCC